jgi:hypothetical protein
MCCWIFLDETGRRRVQTRLWLVRLDFSHLEPSFRWRFRSSDCCCPLRSAYRQYLCLSETDIFSSFSDARERSKESFSESEPLRCSPRTCRRKRLTHATPQAGRFLNARIAPFARCRQFRIHHLSIVRITSKSFDRFLLSQSEGPLRRGSSVFD